MLSWFNERHTITSGNTANFIKNIYTKYVCNVSHYLFVIFSISSVHRLTIHRLGTNRYNELSNTLTRGILYVERRVFKARRGSFIPGAHFSTHSLSSCTSIQLSSSSHRCGIWLALFTLVSRLLHNQNSCLEITWLISLTLEQISLTPRFMNIGLTNI
jgi:hypothetical protein